jgi:hypothetical protein
VLYDDVATVDARKSESAAPASPDLRGALRYLEASGANAISVTTGCGHVVVGVGYRADAVAAYWLSADRARAVAARARKLAGDAADVEGTISTLKEAALQLRVTLTPHDVAISRAGAMAKQLDAFMASMTGTSVLREFNRTFKSRRLAAFARGEQFIKYPIALARLRSALIPLLQNGGKPAVGASLFREVFDT